MKNRGSIVPRPHITVIIPNRNRAQYLYHTLRTCMMQDYDALEVIVSDDRSTDNAREIVGEAASRDSRIRLVSPSVDGGMRNNFEFALNQARPGYVIALGGDDGLLPGGIAGMSEVLRETGTELLAWPAPTYTYPNVRGLPNGQLQMYRTRNEVKIINSSQYLRRQSKRLNYVGDIESPMFYVKGVASTKLIERVRGRSPDKRFYSCPTPDGYSGIVLAGEVSQYVFSGRPFSIYGVSPDSHGVAYLSNDEKAKKASAEFIENIAAKPMHSELASQPYSPLIAIMTADYLLTARDLPGWKGQFPPIDFKHLLHISLKELAQGLYGEDRIPRELAILNRIAERHGLSEYFRAAVRRSKRYRKRTPFAGNGLNSNALFFDWEAYKIHDIVEASYASHFLQQGYFDLSVASIVRVIGRSLSYRLRALVRNKPFPDEKEWLNV